MLIELIAGLAQPPIPALSASDDRLRIKLELHGGCLLGSRRLGLAAAFARSRSSLRLASGQPPGALRRSRSSAGSSSPRARRNARPRPRRSRRPPRGSRARAARSRGRALRGVGVHLRPVDRDHPDPDKAGLRAQHSTSPNRSASASCVALAKPRDRRVIGRLVGRDHPVGDVLHARALDRARGALPPRIRVEQQRDHHRRIERRPPMTVLAIGGVERRRSIRATDASTNHAK